MPTSGPGAPQEHTAPEDVEILPGEKVAAEWEARHDLAARGGAPDPMRVQHYLAHRRSEDSGRAPLPASAEPHGDVPAPRVGSATLAATEPAHAAQGGWRRWFRHGSES